MRIYLDDLRAAPDGWTRAHNFNEFRALIQNGQPIEAISFDHDLGEGEPEGYDIVKWLGNNHPEIIIDEEVEFTVHSDNGPGKENIREYIEFCRRRGKEMIEAKQEGRLGGYQENK
jgi:hypothetical protein